MKRPLKRGKIGLEVEMFVLDNEGHISYDVDKLIRKCGARHLEYAIKKESSKSVLEIGAFPKVKVESAAKSFLSNLEYVFETAEKLDLVLYPHGTYPGKFSAKIRNKSWYKIMETVLGTKRFRLAAGKCAGFHFHYCLPRGVFDSRTKRLKHLVKSKTKEALLNEYNMLIACDPALTTFLQSSPFVNGRYIAKDSRIALYRDMKVKYKDKVTRGLFREYPIFGRLPRYTHTVEDLSYHIERRYSRWIDLMEEKGCKLSAIKGKSTLEFAWNPLRVNKLGTLEQRGMDMNYPKYIFGVATLLKYVLKRIQLGYLKVEPSDIGIKEPFKVENKTVYVPPYTKVKHELQYLSATEGLANEQVLDYCKRFMKFALTYVKEKYDPTLSALKNLLGREKTVSDLIIKMVRKKGYGLDSEIPNDVCAEIALRRANKMLREIEETKNSILVLEE